MKSKLLFCILVAAIVAFGQVGAMTRALDKATVQVGRGEIGSDVLMGPSIEHPVHVVQRRPKAGCDDTQVCGDVISDQWTHNIRTTAGSTCQAYWMAATGSVCSAGTYLAISNSLSAPAEADTTLTGEINNTNGLGRASATVAYSAGTLALVGTPTTAVTGSTGTTYYYWVSACNQGFCTTPSTASGSASAAASLTATNYVTVSFTGQLGASTYQVYRTTSNSIPTGTVSDLVPVSPSCSTSGTTVSCTVTDVGAALTSVTIGTTATTNLAYYTLQKAWTCTPGTQSGIVGFGVFNASTSGTLVFEGTFSSVSLNAGDTLTLTETVYF